MQRIIIVVLLSLFGPGLGQFYNREYKKGTLILFLSFALFFVPLLWLIAKVAPQLPDPNKQLITPEMVRNTVMQTIGQDKHFLNIISFVFLGVWAYAITQAYFKAKEINESGPNETDNNNADDRTKE